MSRTKHNDGPCRSEKLSFVNISLNTKDESVPTIWWPAIIYESFKDLQSGFPKGNETLQKKFVVERHTRCPNSLGGARGKWALLFGGKNKPDNRSIYFVPDDEIESDIKNYFIYIEEMEEKNSDNPDWDLANHDAMNMIATMVPETQEIITSPGGACSYIGCAVNDDALHADLRTIYEETENENGKEEDECNRYDDHSKLNTTKSSLLPKPSTNLDIDESMTGSLSSRADQKYTPDHDTHMNGNADDKENSPRRSSLRSSDKQELSTYSPPRKAPRIQESKNSERRFSPRLQKNDNITPTTKRASKRSSDNIQKDEEEKQEATTSSKRRSPRTQASKKQTDHSQDSTAPSMMTGQVTPTTRASNPLNKVYGSGVNQSMLKPPNRRRTIEKRDHWPHVLDILQKDYGFHYMNGGGGLVDFYWIKAEHRGEKLKYLLNNRKLGKDYFAGETGLKEYVQNRYKWVGPKGNEYKPMENKRSRSSTQKDQSDKISHEQVRKKAKFEKKSKKPTTTAVKANVTQKSKPARAKAFSHSSNKSTKQPKKKEAKAKSTKVRYQSDAEMEEVKKNSTLVKSQTLNERLQSCLECLSDCYNEAHVIFKGSSTSSSFSLKEEKLMEFLNGNNDSGSTIMYVCGKSGIGKTTLVKHCVDLATKTDGETQEIFLNAGNVTSGDFLISEVAMALGKTKNSSSATVEKKLKSSSKNSKDIILVLDEIDFLYDEKVLKKIHKSKDREESSLQCVLRWAKDPTCRLKLVGISNSIGDGNAKMFHQVTKSDELIFQPYNENDLTAIIEKRLGVNSCLIDKIAMTLLCRKVAKGSGDARSVLSIIANAIFEFKETLSDEEKAQKGVDAPVLKMMHMVKSMRNAAPHVEIIHGLPQIQRIVLCVATALSQVSENWKIMSLNDLRTYVNQFMLRKSMNVVDIDQLSDIISRLEDASLVLAGEGDEILHARAYDDQGNRLIRIGVQLEDVELALGNTLLKEDFYKELIAYVKKHHDL